MKSKYKETEVGLLPKDWNMKKLKEISTKITDGDHLTPKRATSGFYLLSARNVKDSYIDLSDVDYVGEEEYQRMKNRCNPEYDDILISCSGTIGRISRVPKNLKSVLVRSVALIKLMKRDYSSGYVQYSLQSNFGQKQINESVNQGAQPNLFLNQINILPIPLPPTLAEQEAIAIVLSDTDALITSLETTIQKKKLLKQGAMQELLTGKRRLPGFGGKDGMKETEVGRIPVDWEVKKLGDVASLSKNRINPVSNPTVFKCIELEHLSQETGRLLGYTSSNELLSQKSIFDFGDILFGKLRPYLRKYLLANFSGVCSTEIWVIKSSRSINNILLYHIMTSDRIIESANLSTGTKMPRAEWKTVSETLIPLPTTLGEQEAIAIMLSEMDEEIEGLEKKLEKTKGIKQGLMQVLLTGKIRLV